MSAMADLSIEVDDHMRAAVMVVLMSGGDLFDARNVLTESLSEILLDIAAGS